jgi:hypothetical protein
MPTSSNITTTASAALKIPAGTRKLVLVNETDTLIRVRVGQGVGTTQTAGDRTTGLPIPPQSSGNPGVFVMEFDPCLVEEKDLNAIVAAGTKTLTWDAYPY